MEFLGKSQGQNPRGRRPQRLWLRDKKNLKYKSNVTALISQGRGSCRRRKSTLNLVLFTKENGTNLGDQCNGYWRPAQLETRRDGNLLTDADSSTAAKKILRGEGGLSLAKFGVPSGTHPSF